MEEGFLLVASACVLLFINFLDWGAEKPAKPATRRKVPDLVELESIPAELASVREAETQADLQPSQVEVVHSEALAASPIAVGT